MFLTEKGLDYFLDTFHIFYVIPPPPLCLLSPRSVSTGNSSWQTRRWQDVMWKSKFQRPAEPSGSREEEEEEEKEKDEEQEGGEQELSEGSRKIIKRTVRAQQNRTWLDCKHW